MKEEAEGLLEDTKQDMREEAGRKAEAAAEAAVQAERWRHRKEDRLLEVALQTQVVELEKRLVVAEGAAQEEAGKLTKAAEKLKRNFSAAEKALREGFTEMEVALKEQLVQAKAKAGQVKSKLIGDGMCLPQWRATHSSSSRQQNTTATQRAESVKALIKQIPPEVLVKAIEAISKEEEAAAGDGVSSYGDRVW